jgi:hypothetical protein
LSSSLSIETPVEYLESEYNSTENIASIIAVRGSENAGGRKDSVIVERVIVKPITSKKVLDTSNWDENASLTLSMTSENHL